VFSFDLKYQCCNLPHGLVFSCGKQGLHPKDAFFALMKPLAMKPRLKLKEDENAEELV
jgi:hypothetical protein